MANATKTCAHCAKTAEAAGLPNLQACARCKTTVYCDRTCQKADYKAHKPACAAPRASHSTTSSAPLRPLEHHVPDPFTRLEHGTFLHARPEPDTFALLIDAFRMRQADDFAYETKTTPGSVYTGAATSAAAFRQFLARAASRKGLLPPWWSKEKEEACVVFGGGGAWSNLSKKATKQGVVRHYGDEKAPMQLRLLAEAVYGVGTMGQSGAAMRRMMMQMESGGKDGYVASMFDVSQRR
ncbi:hypothetical protein C7974DRAFT_103042 [Boeremia exigua]|uniref:uncharacterized protein n=1 Tax=Boeremia exigua TaxID=749465 RepID=UPI001E8EDC68|nr:uncharacterized protein C7974DRAFT_103042 [Boeremia exigua]KAH6642478.1 hypothetical protein C7974DRAFT_103042 [Boeremia exigua]